MKLSFFILILVFSRLTYAGDCATNRFFEGEGWNTHQSDDFKKTTESLRQYIEGNATYLRPDQESIFYSEELDHLIHFQSYDDIRTPDLEMFGDVVLLNDLSTGELIEARWYSNKVKNLIHNQTKEKCAANLIPYADNTLF